MKKDKQTHRKLFSVQVFEQCVSDSKHFRYKLCWKQNKTWWYFMSSSHNDQENDRISVNISVRCTFNSSSPWFVNVQCKSDNMYVRAIQVESVTHSVTKLEPDRDLSLRLLQLYWGVLLLCVVCTSTLIPPWRIIYNAPWMLFFTFMYSCWSMPEAEIYTPKSQHVVNFSWCTGCECSWQNWSDSLWCRDAFAPLSECWSRLFYGA